MRGIASRILPLLAAVLVLVLAACSASGLATPSPTPMAIADMPSVWSDKDVALLIDYVTQLYRHPTWIAPQIADILWIEFDAYPEYVTKEAVVLAAKMNVDAFWFQLFEKQISRMEEEGIHRWDEIPAIDLLFRVWVFYSGELREAKTLTQFMAADQLLAKATQEFQEAVGHVMEGHFGGDLSPRLYLPRAEK